MSLSVYLAWVFGPFFIVVGLSMLLNRAYYRDMVERFFNDPQDYFFSGAAALAGGLALVAGHNVWVLDWPLLITLIGWAMIVKGVLRLAVPQFGRGFFTAALKTHSHLALSGVILLVAGAYLAWSAWRAGGAPL